MWVRGLGSVHILGQPDTVSRFSAVLVNESSGSHMGMGYESVTLVVTAPYRATFLSHTFAWFKMPSKQELSVTACGGCLAVLYLLTRSVGFWKDEMCSNEPVINITELRHRWWQCSM